MFRGTDHMQKRSLLSLGSWVAIALVLWIIAWVIAEAIPVFNNLLSLIVCSRYLDLHAYGLTSCNSDGAFRKLVYLYVRI